MIEYIGYFFVSAGVVFNLFGAFALVRFPDVYTRLLSSTKCVTLGTASILLGIFIVTGFTAAGLKALACMLFLLLTSPVEAHALLRAAHRSGIKLWKGSVTDQYEEDKKRNHQVSEAS